MTNNANMKYCANITFYDSNNAKHAKSEIHGEYRFRIKPKIVFVTTVIVSGFCFVAMMHINFKINLYVGYFLRKKFLRMFL